MPAYPRSSVLRDKSIRKMVGSAIYVDIAIAVNKEFGTTKLENLVNGRKLGDYTGQYRKMLQGIVPDPTSCKIIQKRTKGGCDLILWRDHPLWSLISQKQSTPDLIEKTLRLVNSSVKKYIWTYPPEAGYNRKSLRMDPSVSLIKTVAEFNNFDAFLILTAWAKEAHDHKLIRNSYQSAIHTRKLFPRVVCNTPQLFIRWPLLAEQYRKNIWTAPKSEVSEPWFSMRLDEIADEIDIEEKIARENGVNLPPKHIFRSVNKLH